MNKTHLQITEDHADPLRMDELTRRLHRDLTDRGLEVERPSDAVPRGAKSGAAATIGAIGVVVASSPVIAALVEGVFAWLAAGRVARAGRSVKITHGDLSIELSDSTAEQRQHLIEWLTRHTGTRDEHS